MVVKYAENGAVVARAPLGAFLCTVIKSLIPRQSVVFHSHRQKEKQVVSFLVMMVMMMTVRACVCARARSCLYHIQ